MLSKDEFDAWRSEPATRVFMRYLDDCAEGIRDEWRDGENWTESARYEVETYKAVQTVTHEDIETFYADKAREQQTAIEQAMESDDDGE